jgi:protein involved in polysaccharide export with SLBB domain
MKLHIGIILLAGLAALFWAAGLVVRADETLLPNASGHVYFEGEIREGALALTSEQGMTASQAIVAEGGLGAMADGRHVYILRHGMDGTSRKIDVDFVDIIAGGHSQNDPVLMAGDTIVVPLKATQTINLHD